MAFNLEDAVYVNLDAHKKEPGIICHITEDNTLFIKMTNGKRLRILANERHKSITFIEKSYSKPASPNDIQLYISRSTNNDGRNYQIIGANYEAGLNQFPLDFNKALHWYSSGHVLNNMQCTSQLARIYADYYHDFDAAEAYWNIGIERGYIYCAFYANVMFRTVPNGKDKELYYIKKYVELTNSEDVGGLVSLSVCQMTRDPPEYHQAYLYLAKAHALDASSIGLQQFLAFLEFRGLGCDRNESKAIEIHRRLASDKESECCMLWMAVYTAMQYEWNDIHNIHPLRDVIYDSLMDVIDNGDRHGLYYGNWIKIIEYNALKECDVMSCGLLIALKIFGILQCEIDIKHATKCVYNIMNNNTEDIDCSWMKSWHWFFSERYKIIEAITGMTGGLIDVVTQMELSIITPKISVA